MPMSSSAQARGADDVLLHNGVGGITGVGSGDASGHILDESEMFVEVSCRHREHVCLVAWCVANVGGDETFMQLVIANRQKTHHDWLRIGDPGYNTNALASGESARTAEGDGRGKKILNLRIAAVSDLPNLASTRKRCWFAHDTNCGLTSGLTLSQRRLTPKCNCDNQISATVQLDVPQPSTFNSQPSLCPRWPISPSCSINRISATGCDAIYQNRTDPFAFTGG